MTAEVKACVVVGFGINADEELALAFSLAGAAAERVHVADLIEEPRRLRAYRILAFPGGFSFGDHLGSGKVFALLFKRNLGEALREFVDGGGLVIGVCNGFQILVKMGLLPDLAGDFRQEVSLIHNDSGKYEDRWVRLSFAGESPCLWTRGLSFMDAPVRHGEGKLVTGAPETLAALEAGGLAAVRYVSRNSGPVLYPDNPNGSSADIAGLCDRTGRTFGLMPHPEAFLFRENHPDWTRGSDGPKGESYGAGLAIFRAGVAAARE
jgi:phosphoribosylformylglycinamidine (FGAM) synthase-like amidotransferase family enzyme